MVEMYIDNAVRKRIVTFWIPVCLGFLHLWATLFNLALIIPTQYTNYKPEQLKSIDSGFEICGWGIAALILLLISDKALEFFISRTSSAFGGVLGSKTTETRTIETTGEQNVINVP